MQATVVDFKRLIISGGINNKEDLAEPSIKLVCHPFRFILATLENEGE